MKIFLVIGTVLFWAEITSAQMNDALGTLLIDSELSNQSYQAVGQGQKALNRLHFQQDLATLVSEIQTSYFGNYAELSKSGLSFNGFLGLTWDIAASDDGGFYVILDNVDYPTCFICQGNSIGARQVEINDSRNCLSGSNKVRLLF